MQKWGRMPENLKWAVQKQEAYIYPEGLKTSVLEAQVKCLTQIENGSPDLPPAQLNEKVKEAIMRQVRKPRKTWHAKRKQEMKTAKLEEWLIKDAQSLNLHDARPRTSPRNVEEVPQPLPRAFWWLRGQQPPKSQENREHRKERC